MLAQAARGCTLQVGEFVVVSPWSVFRFLSKEIRIKVYLSCTIASTGGMQENWSCEVENRREWLCSL